MFNHTHQGLDQAEKDANERAAEVAERNRANQGGIEPVASADVRARELSGAVEDGTLADALELLSAESVAELAEAAQAEADRRAEEESDDA